MKKIIALCLVLAIGLSLCACGQKGTKLTLDNYETYFEIQRGQTTCEEVFHPSVSPVDGLYWDIEVNGDYLPVHRVKVYPGTAFGIAVKVTAVSDNFNYNNVRLKVKVSGSYDEIRLSGNMWFLSDGGSDFEAVVDVPVNIAGDGSGVAIVRLPDGVVSCARRFDEHAIEMEVIEVSGLITGA